MYILASHNSWSYAKPKKWWMRPFRFVAQCQDYDIRTQYNKYGVRCFDLRIKFDEEGNTIISHGKMVYDLTFDDIQKDLQFLNDRGDCYVRVIHEARTEKEYYTSKASRFDELCYDMEVKFPRIKFWGGKNLYTWECDHAFIGKFSCDEKYSSVCPPRILDDWFPRLYAKINNHKNLEKGTNKDIYMIDFVNYR